MSKKKCASCFREMCSDDNFCAYCGGKPSRRLFPRMLPKQDRASYKVAVIYGPPLNFIFECAKCSNKWEMFMTPHAYCPRCGTESNGAVTEEDK
jgi:rRNA maturation endonuclease Nob1